MLSKKCLLSLFLIGCTSLFAIDDRFSREVFLCAQDIPTEVINIIVDKCNKLKERFKLCSIYGYDKNHSCSLPYDKIKSVPGESIFESHDKASSLANNYFYYAYVLNNGLIFRDGKQIARTVGSERSYQLFQKDQAYQALRSGQ